MQAPQSVHAVSVALLVQPDFARAERIVARQAVLDVLMDAVEALLELGR